MVLQLREGAFRGRDHNLGGVKASPAGQSQRAGQVQEAGVAVPGGKWGDLTSAVYSASGDLIHISTGGVLAFASVLHYPVRFINKYWANDPSVGVHDASFSA